MNWSSLIISLIRLAIALTAWTREKGLLKAGQDQAIAKASLEMLEATKRGQAIREAIASLDDQSASKLWESMIDGT
jgi:hypothetical protein